MQTNICQHVNTQFPGTATLERAHTHTYTHLHTHTHTHTLSFSPSAQYNLCFAMRMTFTVSSRKKTETSALEAMKGVLPWQLKLIIYLYDLESKQIPALYIFRPVFAVKQYALPPPWVRH